MNKKTDKKKTAKKKKPKKTVVASKVETSLSLLVSDKVLKRAKKLIVDKKLINAQKKKGKIVGEVRGRSSLMYVCSVLDTGEFLCSCPGQAAHSTKLCSHLTATLLVVDNEDYVRRVTRKMFQGEVDSVFQPTDIFETSITGMNQLLKGGIPRQCLFGLYGLYKAGKTILVYQLAWEVMATTGVNALMIDTESDYLKPDAFPIWASRFNERFGIAVQLVKVTCHPRFGTKSDERKKIKDIKFKYYPENFDRDRQTVFVLDEGKFEVLIALFGKPVAPRVKGGKIDLMPMDTSIYVFFIQRSLIGQFVEKHKIQFLSIDSMTRPFAAFHGGRVNYPVRNEGENLWFAQVDELIKAYDMVCVCTHKQTKNPTSQYDRPEPKGGKAVGHWFKRMLHLNKIGKSVKRRLKVYRVPTEAEWDESAWSAERFLYLSNKGFKDYVE